MSTFVQLLGTLSSWQQKMFTVVKHNEVGNSGNPYCLSLAPTGDGGFSFGWLQWDMKKQGVNSDSYKLLGEAIDSINEADFQSVVTSNPYLNSFSKTDLKNLMKSASNADTSKISKINLFRNLIDSQLAFPSFEQKIDNLTISTVVNIENTVNDVANGTGIYLPKSQSVTDYFNQNDWTRVFLADYHNQFFITPGSNPYGKLDQFLSGQIVHLNHNQATVKIEGTFGLDDILNFYLNTEYGNANPKVVLKRFSTIIDVFGENNISLLKEDREYLRDLGNNATYQQFLGKTDYKALNKLIKRADKELSAALGWYEYLFGDGNAYAADLITAGRDFFERGQAAAIPRRIDPLIFDLDGDGTETTDLAAGAHFDHNGDGFAEQTSWVASDDGLLVMDRNCDGAITNGGELFGDQTVLMNGAKASSGFQALAELDENRDGIIDSTDTDFSRLRIWWDSNGDGYSSPGELFTLDELGIRSINLNTTITNITDAQGNTQQLVGSFDRVDGTTGQVGAYIFQRDPTFSIPGDTLSGNDIPVPDDIASLPELQGYGVVYGLRQAMARDTSGDLKSLVEQFVAATDVSTRNGLLDQIPFQWTGASDIDPNSRGGNFDARKLTVLEKFLGLTFTSQYGANPIQQAVVHLNESYKSLSEMFYAELMAQTHLATIYEKISYTYDDAAQAVKVDMSAVISDLKDRLATDYQSGIEILGEFSRSIRGFQFDGTIDFLGFREAFASEGEEALWAIDSGGKNSILGTSAGESLAGTAYSDAMWGKEGNDSILGDGGDDIISGGDGNDCLFGNDGNDILDGSAGNDTLIGGAGNDTYVFGRGQGQDTIFEGDGAGNTDTLRFAPDIARSDVEITRIGDHVVFRIIGTSDQVMVNNWIAASANQLDQVEFGDGTVLTAQQVTDQSSCRPTRRGT